MPNPDTSSGSLVEPYVEQIVDKCYGFEYMLIRGGEARI
jgi:hypothetical protein